MSSFSRRSLLGYSGSAAAGAVLASGGTAQAASTVGASTAVGASAESEAAAVEFPPGTEFSGNSSLSVEDEDAYYYLKIGFTFEISGWNGDTPPAENVVTPAEIASALSAIAVSKGWPPITFSGRPAPVAIN
ncbi:hypothetical protein OG250_37975 [Streptomyces sp. NBC_00487]|uniref:hypothetical protein n=1 Tax=unclassified Streptomyces TaxID=2593676 RepID=UPI002E17DCA1|nr:MULTISPECIES: hypothetical protein [unclassified Streptomyces]